MAVEGKVKSEKKADQKGIVKFFREVKAETKRITWPSKKDIKKATIAVVGFCLLYTALVGALDMLFKNLFAIIFRIK